LAEKFWERLYPLPEGDDITPRIRLLGGVLMSASGPPALLLPVKRILITADKHSFLDLDRSNRLQAISDPAERNRYINSDANKGSDVKTLSEFQQLVLQTPDHFYRNLVEDLTQCIDELDKLDDMLAQKCGVDKSGRERAPLTSDTRKVLEERQKELKSLLGDRLAAPPTGEQQPESGAGGNELSPTTAVSSMVAQNTEQEMTRDLAFRLLADLALFFRRVEPHSPVSHHIEQAIRWGKMTLPELLEELIADENLRQQVFTRVGIERTENPQ
jgi:type VI secretion system protein ImpA